MFIWFSDCLLFGLIVGFWVFVVSLREVLVLTVLFCILFGILICGA